MLSPSTLSFLSELQEKSHAAYSEGGLLYTYVEAANQAHSRYPESAVGSSIGRTSQLAVLGRFLQASQGDYVSEAVAPQFLLASQQLMEHVRADLNFDEMILIFKDGGHDMEATVKMARRSDNRFFELELWWSID